MYEIVNIRLRLTGEVITYDVNNVGPHRGDWCVVELDKGLDLGDVAGEIKMVLEREVKHPLPKVIRLMTPGDDSEFQENTRKEKAAYHSCNRMIREKNLLMRLIGAEYFFDRSKLIFYFTAEARVDFRDLVKDLAQLFQTRIEMRQIGVRDAARMLDGLGVCGRKFCCSSFLKKFIPVTIKMAKDQNLALNPEKLSGLCGRLLCCLGYEECDYIELGRGAPREGMKIRTSHGQGKVKGVNLLKQIAQVDLESGGEITLPFSEIKKVKRRT
jgi:cell fate regulator YaaT (PSP1 superfamily)